MTYLFFTTAKLKTFVAKLKSSFAAISHSHSISDVTNLTETLVGKAAKNHTHSQYLTAHQDISGKENTSNKVTSLSSTSTDTEYPSAKCMYKELVGKATSAHSHAISDIASLPLTLEGKAAKSHTHAISDVTDLQTTLNSKAASSHSHAISDVTNLQTTLNPLLIENFGKVRLMFIDKEAYLLTDKGYIEDGMNYRAIFFRWTKSIYRYRKTEKRSKHIGWIAPTNKKDQDYINFWLRDATPDDNQAEDVFRIVYSDKRKYWSLLDRLLSFHAVEANSSSNFYIANRRCALRILDINNNCWVSDYLPFMIKYNSETNERGIGRWHK